MRNARHTGTFNITLLSAQLQERFHSLFTVVEKRTIFSWVEAPIATAQVVVTDDKNATLPATASPCLAFVGSRIDAEGLKPGFKHIFQIEPSFTVSQLLDVLDRAAVRLLDSRHATLQAPAPAREASIARYKLKRWVVLSKDFASASYTTAVALLTRGHVTLEAICAHTGLAFEEARALIAELDSQGALLISDEAPAAALPETPAQSKADSSADKGQNGMFGKLARWLSANRSFSAK